MKQKSFLLLTSLLLTVAYNTASASEETNSAGKELIRHFVNDVRTLSGSFKQSLVDANDDIVETSNGTFEILRPGRFRWTYTEPYEQVLVADGLNVWSYDVDLAQVTVKPQAETLGSTPAMLLGGSDGVLDDFDFVGSFSDRGTVWVRLKPKDAASSFDMVELGFSDGDLSRMIFSDDLEQTTLVALFDVKVNEEVDASIFNFTPPEGVDVVGKPIDPSGS